MLISAKQNFTHLHFLTCFRHRNGVYIVAIWSGENISCGGRHSERRKTNNLLIFSMYLCDNNLLYENYNSLLECLTILADKIKNMHDAVVFSK